jgi:serine/threonine protein kinase
MIGTADYVAPEVINNSYDSRCDIWSIGCLAHMMLAGSPPFVENTEELTFAAIKKGQVVFDLKCWETISDQAKDFILKLLTMDYKERPTA